LFSENLQKGDRLFAREKRKFKYKEKIGNEKSEVKKLFHF
jgi:stalled ribosome rescue protein Dom34